MNYTLINAARLFNAAPLAGDNRSIARPFSFLRKHRQTYAFDHALKRKCEIRASGNTVIRAVFESRSGAWVNFDVLIPSTTTLDEMENAIKLALIEQHGETVDGPIQHWQRTNAMQG